MNYKLTARELSSFCGQMGMLLHSGISTTEGLHILCDESKTDTDREILTPLIRSVEENGSLSQALEEVGCFPASMNAYVKTGEETGCLDEIMNSLSEHYKQEQEISQQIRSAVTYPLIMLGMMAVVILVLLVKVLPVFQQVFQQMGLEMNGVSRGLLNAGNVISHYSAVFLILAAVLIGFTLFSALPKKAAQASGNWLPICPYFVRSPLPWITAVWPRDCLLAFEAVSPRKQALNLQKRCFHSRSFSQNSRKPLTFLRKGKLFQKRLQNPDFLEAWRAVLSVYRFIPDPAMKLYTAFPNSTLRNL